MINDSNARVDAGNSLKIYEEFRELGFAAGITLKGPWADQKIIYQFVKDRIMARNLHLVVPEQVHGSEVVYLGNDDSNFQFEADGVIAVRPGLCLTVTTADCLPLLLADPVSGLFAAVHIGWRSYVAGILENLFGVARGKGLNKGETKVFLGPAIGPCCFQVGWDVAILFDEKFLDFRYNSVYVNLREAARNKLLLLGVDEDNMRGVPDCTSCDMKHYYSYRRDKESPLQMVSFIYKLPI